MDEVFAYFTEVSTKLPGYARYIYVIVIFAIIALTQAIKLPLRKYVLDVKITDVKVRKKVNLVFMILPFGLGLAASGVLTCFGYPFSWEAGIAWGVYSQVAYELVARIILKLKNNEEITDAVIADEFNEAKDSADTIENKVVQTTKAFEDFVKQIKGE